MGNKIVIIKKDDYVISGLLEGNELVEVQADKDDTDSLLGNIYLGKVKNIVRNINAAFIEVANKQMCYLSLADVSHPVFSNNDHPGKMRIGDEVVVQVTKERASYKAPLCSTEFNLTGKYLVLVHGKPALGVSQKIKDETQRNRLKQLIKPYITEEYGFIVRTNAETADDATLTQELSRLSNDYRNIVDFGVHWTCFSKLYGTPPSFIWEIRDSYSEGIDEIKTDDKELFSRIRDYMQVYQPEDVNKLVLYEDDNLSLSKLYCIEEKMERALYERVWLKSGAYLIIQPTEACTVIDVNTGKAIKSKGDQEQTFLSVNIEAANEIAKQVRLRNISGIIIIDFIDMTEDRNRKTLMKVLQEVLSKDRIPTRVVDMTALNLVEVTRKKIRKPLREQLNN